MKIIVGVYVWKIKFVVKKMFENEFKILIIDFKINIYLLEWKYGKIKRSYNLVFFFFIYR